MSEDVKERPSCCYEDSNMRGSWGIHKLRLGVGASSPLPPSSGYATANYMLTAIHSNQQNRVILLCLLFYQLNHISVGCSESEGNSMSLWTKAQQLQGDALKKVRAVYGEHFPIEVRHFMAAWIEENMW
ncbi:unnamed protein product [Timema podura]|uniref:STAT transcription factor protein interaction domain-containing protein n=1 Tax=Timema podura TaxID=61482 RepID=A0ABN7NX51_TIMPD|nr:unnamed protein product [Timema podura]